MTGQGLFIGGRWEQTDASRPTFDRWTGEPTGHVAVASAADAVRAVDAAAAAMRTAFPVADRARVLAETARLVETRSEALAQLITAEVGKPITASRAEVGRAAETLRTCAEEARRLPSETVPLDAVPAGEGTFAFTIPTPMGVVAAITPFNFPLNLLLHKVGPAIAAGCAVVVKPSDHAPRTAGFVADLLHEAGLPAGWIGIVTGPPAEIVDALQSDDRVEVVTFTGSSEVGWRLKESAPKKHHVLELGSNTALVVAADADLARAARAATDAALGNSGQACVSLQRVYVERPAADAFIDALAAAVAASPVGDPRDERTVVGPLITGTAVDRLSEWIADATADGARLVTGGGRDGDVLAPTVLADVAAQSPLVCEEAFGPVVSVVPVDDLAAALDAVNASRYALNTAIYTSDLATAMWFAREAEAGSVLVNMPPSFRADHMPYGGVKDSGQGREGVKYAIDALVRQRLVVLHP
ncbi:aldehyde dehydrogenase family protein [Agromyces silvae]|uniref:aldehyde dehydrogenase family protein n=1 Tax=Agromyces silvae TaxID=3388266 RepID=UPI00280B14BF|nr:aldehyde dehydrogenase family protein [Agromyces protaetiae]